MTEKPDDEFSLEELRLARIVFTSFVALSTLLILAVNVFIAAGGYFSWPWFLVIPAGAAGIFAARVVRRYNRNILDGVLRDVAVQTEYQVPVRPANDFMGGAIRFGGGSVVAAIVIMLCVSGIWYLLGIGVRWLSSLS